VNLGSYLENLQTTSVRMGFNPKYFDLFHWIIKTLPPLIKERINLFIGTYIWTFRIYVKDRKIFYHKYFVIHRPNDVILVSFFLDLLPPLKLIMSACSHATQLIYHAKCAAKKRKKRKVKEYRITFNHVCSSKSINLSETKPLK